MKRFFLVLFCFLSLAFIFSQAVIIEVPETTAGIIIRSVDSVVCDTVEQSETDLDGGGDDFGRLAGNCWYATRFITTSAYTPCAVEIGIQSITGDVSGITFWAHIYSDVDVGGGDFEPDATLCNGQKTGAAYAVGFSAGNKHTLVACPELADATAYWVVWTVGTGNHNGDNYVVWDTEDGVTEREEYGADGAAWANDSTTKTLSYKIYK